MAESIPESPSQLGYVLDPVELAGCNGAGTADSPIAAVELSPAGVVSPETVPGAGKLVISAEEQERSIRELEEELDDAKASVELLSATLKEKDERKARVLNELDQLREKIKGANADSVVEKLMLLLRSVKGFERKEIPLKSYFEVKRAELESEINELEAKMSSDCDCKSLSEDLDQSLGASVENLHRAKMELGATLRTVLLLRRQFDDLPSQSEIAQYEYRLLELNVNIGEKDRQTRKFYATYNALLEIKALMLKEISLLNSINSQFQDAIASSAGQSKLIDSMEGILKGIQQKLEKMQCGLQAEQKICDTLRERYVAAVADRRRGFTLSKAFQQLQQSGDTEARLPESCNIDEENLEAAISRCTMLEIMDVRFCQKILSVSMGRLRTLCRSEADIQ